MTRNCQILSDYVNTLQPDILFARPYEVRRPKPETRQCIVCGKPYTLLTPYDLCNPGLRDLCDNCLLKGGHS